SRILAHHQAWRSFVPVLALGALSFIAPNLSTAEIAIVSGSAPRATIVLGKNAGDLDRFAGSELQNYIERLSGVRLRQMSESEVGSLKANETILLLGAANQNEIERDLETAGSVSTKALQPEGFVLKTLTWKEHPIVVLAGADAAGT